MPPPRKDRRAVLLALPASNHNLASLEIDVFDVKLEAFLKSQSSAVQESDDDPAGTIELFHDARDFVMAQHDRHTNRHAGAGHVFDAADLRVQHVTVQEQDRAERLTLRRSADVTGGGEPRQKDVTSGASISDGCRLL
jgi:hypothetical protein